MFSIWVSPPFWHVFALKYDRMVAFDWRDKMRSQSRISYLPQLLNVPLSLLSTVFVSTVFLLLKRKWVYWLFSDFLKVICNFVWVIGAFFVRIFACINYSNQIANDLLINRFCTCLFCIFSWHMLIYSRWYSLILQLSTG